MLSRLASYLLRGVGSGADDDRGASATQEAEAARANNQVNGSIPVEARLRQVEVEGDDWILIDHNVEGYTAMEESWYVTPPACFTLPGPVHVETSPLEDLLIEHPSMSVYRAAGPASLSSDKLLTAEPKPHRQHHSHHQKQQQRAAKRHPSEASTSSSTGATRKVPTVPLADAPRLPLAPRNGNLQVMPATTHHQSAEAAPPKAVAVAKNPNKASNANNSSSNNNRHHYHHHHHHHQNGGAVAEPAPRRANVRELRGDENMRIVQIRSAQKMLEKRTTQSAKRNRLERSNKVREVSSGKGRRPRRQDRLRLNNSGANNNRKC